MTALPLPRVIDELARRRSTFSSATQQAMAWAVGAVGFEGHDPFLFLAEGADTF